MAGTRGKGTNEGREAAGRFSTGASGPAGSVTFDQAALARLLEGPDGPVGKDLARKAIRCQAAAKRLCPVDTGRLRASIAWRMGHDFGGLYAIVGTNVHYAAPVEFGTRTMRARPYLRPALAEAVGRP